MEAVILGSGTCVPSIKRNGPSLLIRVPGKNILVDTGLGCLEALLGQGLTYKDIDIILFTHIHPDHTAELVSFLFACKYGEDPRKAPLTIIGGKGFSAYFDKLKGVHGKWIEPELFELTVQDLYDDSLSLGPTTIVAKRVAHIEESVGFRVEDGGKVIAVSGDTEYCQGVVELGREADLLVLECSFPDDKAVPGHLTPSSAARVANESRCGRVVLTHFYPSCDLVRPESVVRREYWGEVILADDLARIKV